jgi:Mlc titration factor MtfA (ptsG expression regulator)
MLRFTFAAIGAAFLPLALLGHVPWLGALGAGVASGLIYVSMTRRFRRRRRLLSSPFPDAWRRILQRRVPYYARLTDEGRNRFEDDVRIFLDEQRIYGARGFEVDDHTRLLIGSSAAMMAHGLPDWEWPNVRDIVVHPGAFDDDYKSSEEAHISGMVHHQGPVLYSDKDLRHGFRREDGSNVGLHELAHVMDLADGYADGIPAGAEWIADAPWMQVVHDRLVALRQRKYAHLRDYAATNEAEFFAVAVEAFFERPRRLQARDPELYSMLAEYFRQDPATPDG